MIYDNVAEELHAIADWLDCNHINLSYGLKSIEDTIKLWHYMHTNSTQVDEMPDDWSSAEFKKAIGYDPIEQQIRKEYFETFGQYYEDL